MLKGVLGAKLGVTVVEDAIGVGGSAVVLSKLIDPVFDSVTPSMAVMGV